MAPHSAHTKRALASPAQASVSVSLWGTQILSLRNRGVTMLINQVTRGFSTDQTSPLLR